jgi:ABC-type transporter Mla subunit MlaD
LTEDLIGKLTEATTTLADTVGKGGADLHQAAADAGGKLRGEATGFGKDVKQAAEQFRLEVTAAMQGMKQMADDFSERVLVLDGVVDKARPAGEAIAQAQNQLQKGIASLGQASQAVKSAGDQLGQQGQAARATVGELKSVTQSIRESTDALNAAWDQHQQRFDQVDQNAAKMFQEIKTSGVDWSKARSWTTGSKGC